MITKSPRSGRHVAPKARQWCKAHPFIALAVAAPVAIGGGSAASAATGHLGGQEQVSQQAVQQDSTLHLRPAVRWYPGWPNKNWPVTPRPTSSVPAPAPTDSAPAPAPTDSAPAPVPSETATSPAPTDSATSPAPAPSETATSPAPTGSAPAPTGSPTDSAPAPGSPMAEVVRLTNEERAKAGCGPLTVEPHLTQSAQGHASDMVKQQYFDHNSKDGSSPFDRMKRAGFTGGAMGENIAAGQSTPQDVMTGWMNSPGHKANILNCSFNQIGVGYDAGVVQPGYGGGSWVQNFGTL